MKNLLFTMFLFLTLPFFMNAQAAPDNPDNPYDHFGLVQYEALNAVMPMVAEMEDKSRQNVVPLLVQAMNERSQQQYDYSIDAVLAQELNYAAATESPLYYGGLVDRGLASAALSDALMQLDQMIANASNLDDLTQDIKTFEGQFWDGMTPQERIILWMSTATARYHILFWNDYYPLYSNHCCDEAIGESGIKEIVREAVKGAAAGAMTGAATGAGVLVTAGVGALIGAGAEAVSQLWDWFWD